MPQAQLPGEVRDDTGVASVHGAEQRQKEVLPGVGREQHRFIGLGWECLPSRAILAALFVDRTPSGRQDRNGQERTDFLALKWHK